MHLNREVAVYPKAEPNSQPETYEELRTRATSRLDINGACDYLQDLPKRNMKLLDRVKIGYLLHTSSDEESAKWYVDAHDIRFQSIGDFKKLKLEFHINFALLRDPSLDPKKKPTKRPREDATPSHAREEPDPQHEGDPTNDDDFTYYDQGRSVDVGCGRTQVAVHDAAVGPTQMTNRQ
jgi:hypothetical protein